MADVDFHLGKGITRVQIPDSNLVEIHSPPDLDPPGSEGELLRKSLAGPIQAEPIPSQVGSGDKVLIILDDITRQTPTRRVIPSLRRELDTAGIKEGDIEILFALGTHRYMTREEMEIKAGARAVREISTSNHYWRDQSKLRDLGTTDSGIPITVNEKILEADWSIGVGNIVPHRVAGYTGGGKIVQPGLGGPQTTGLTHLMAGKFESEEILGVAENPVRREIEEISEKAGLDMIINTVLDGKSRTFGFFSGHPISAHREGVETSNRIYDVPIDHKVDVAIVDSHPADIDMWQAVKALEAAELAVKPGGTIVMLTPCWEGISEEHPELEKHGYLYPSKALSLMDSGELTDLCSVAAMVHVGKILEKMRVIVYAVGIPRKDVENLGFEYAPSPQEAVDRALEDAGKSAEAMALKGAAEVVPRIGE